MTCSLKMSMRKSKFNKDFENIILLFEVLYFRIEYELTLTRFCNHEMRNPIPCDFWDFPQNQ